MNRKRWILLGCVATAALLAAWIGWERHRGQTALSAQIEEWKVLGESLDPVPAQGDPSSLEHLAQQLLSLTNAMSQISAAAGNMPLPMTYARPGQARCAWRTYEPSPASTWPGTHAALDQHMAAVDALAALFSDPELPLGGPYTSGFLEVPAPPVALLHQAASLLTVSTIAELQRQNWDTAHNRLLSLLRFLDRTQHDPILLVQGLRHACGTYAAALTWEILQSTNLADSHLESIEQAWDSIHFLAPLVQSLENERCMTWQHFRLVASSRDIAKQAAHQKILTAKALLGSRPSADDQLLLIHVQMPLWRLAWWQQDCLRALERWQQVISSARQVQTLGWQAAAHSLDLIEQSTSAKPQGWYDRWRFLLSEDPSSVQPKFIRQAAMMETTKELARTAVALQRFRMAHSRLPAQTLELVPRFLKSLPRDPLDAQPLRYRPDGADNYCLYSIGFDASDDQGSPDPNTLNTPPGLWSGRDTVWPTLDPDPSFQPSSSLDRPLATRTRE